MPQGVRLGRTVTGIGTKCWGKRDKETTGVPSDWNQGLEKVLIRILGVGEWSRKLMCINICRRWTFKLKSLAPVAGEFFILKTSIQLCFLVASLNFLFG